ncbi:class I SAM-dependent methyltransferase [uncultured Bacteroides sp.]|uniref:class I SAM-dependent methyltransferase n=1 Tax=uncultured Bacteroides sp. TaxID=162156 RepID=UPI002AAB41C5|nr:class I SAM-dependent methyltransferase [uncultured Bacteroides sp.]
MKRKMFYKRALIWLLRFRHRKGYGVHSPFAFNLITGVFFEKAPYYDYEYLREIVCKARKKSPALWKRYIDSFRIYELLFRLANDAKPHTILEIGTSAGVSSLYLSCSRKEARFITLDEKSPANDLAIRLFSYNSNKIDYRTGDVSALLPEAIYELNTLDFLLLHPGEYSLSTIQTMFEQCMNKSNPCSVFVIQDIYSSSEIKNWWRELVADERLGITFDLYDMGIIYFDKKKIKQHYIVNF